MFFNFYFRVCVLFLLVSFPSAIFGKRTMMSKLPDGMMMMIKCTKDGKIMKSNDNGLVWHEIHSHSNGAADPSFSSLASDLKGEKLIAVGKEDGMYLSHDYGKTWSTVNVLKTSEAVSRLVKRDWEDVTSDALGENLAAVTTDGKIYYSNDQGKSWKPSTVASKKSIHWKSVVSDQTGQYVAAASAEGIHLSFDFGSSWIKAPNLPENVDVKWNEVVMDFSGQYLVGTTVSSSEIYHSSDHGMSWRLGEIVVSETVSWKSIASDQSGQFPVACTSNGMLFLSRDYGISWEVSKEFPHFENCDSVIYDNTGTILLVTTDKDLVYVSSDKGVSWSSGAANLDGVMPDSHTKDFSSLFKASPFASFIKQHPAKNNDAEVPVESGVSESASMLDFQNLLSSYACEFGLRL
jgi:photosystem II stability/assembly factor-like uncharacterized protein